MNHARRSFGGAVALALVGAAGACIGPDRTLPPPIRPVVPSDRIRLAVPPTRNESPLAVVADVTAETNRMLAALLERTGRFVPADDAGFRLETAVTAVRDEDATESVVFEDAGRFGLRRRAVVEMSYRLVDAAGRTLVRGAVSGDDVVIGADSLPPPERRSLETGAFWNTTLGRATRDALDALVREIAESA
ncbi:MAG: hypothetical protein ACF8XB_08735 [Planctomycetota bacterium JB042]